MLILETYYAAIKLSITLFLRRRGGLSVNAFTPDQAVSVRALAGVLCCVLWEDTLFHSASLHQGVQMGKDEFNARGNPAMN